MHPHCDSASHCFGFEQDFVGTWRCIPLCVRRKLDLVGIKLKLSHWLALDHDQRQQLVDWPDSPDSGPQLRDHLRQLTTTMADGMVKDLPAAAEEPWQQAGVVPAFIAQAAQERGLVLGVAAWGGLSELERFALCKLARPGHDHHNLDAAFTEVLG